MISEAEGFARGAGARTPNERAWALPHVSQPRVATDFGMPISPIRLRPRQTSAASICFDGMRISFTLSRGIHCQLRRQSRHGLAEGNRPRPITWFTPPRQRSHSCPQIYYSSSSSSSSQFVYSSSPSQPSIMTVVLSLQPRQSNTTCAPNAP